MVDTAEKLIWNSLNVSNLIKESNALNVITHLLLENISDERISKLSLRLGGDRMRSLTNLPALGVVKTDETPKEESCNKLDENLHLKQRTDKLVEQPNPINLAKSKENYIPGLYQISSIKNRPSVDLQYSDYKSSLKDQLSILFNDYYNKAVQSSPFLEQDTPFSHLPLHKNTESASPGHQTPPTNLLSSPRFRLRKVGKVANARSINFN